MAAHVNGLRVSEGKHDLCHGLSSDLPSAHRTNNPSSRAFTVGHSDSIMLKYTECRSRPSGMMMWFRIVPSSTAPMRSSAAREGGPGSPGLLDSKRIAAVKVTTSQH